MAKFLFVSFLLPIITLAWDLAGQKLPFYYIHKSHRIKVIDGISLWEITRDLCESISYEECVDLTYSVSVLYYGTAYFPSRSHSCIEDFYYQRKHLITYITQRFQFSSYLEIGCDHNQTFGEIESLFQRSACVDPFKGGTIRMTSDEFFEQNVETFDVIFIDGLHQAPQVWSLTCSITDIFFIFQLISCVGVEGCRQFIGCFE
jgi:hypothetical protein